MSAELFTVRSAQLQDAPAIAALEEQCVQESGNYRGSSQLLAEVPPVGQHVERHLNDSQHKILVIESAGEICGYADMELANAVAVVRRIYVHNAARELGAGATLIEQLRASAKLHGCTRIDAYALPGDRLTKNLFERAGMKARLLIASSEL